MCWQQIEKPGLRSALRGNQTQRHIALENVITGVSRVRCATQSTRTPNVGARGMSRLHHRQTQSGFQGCPCKGCHAGRRSDSIAPFRPNFCSPKSLRRERHPLSRAESIHKECARFLLFRQRVVWARRAPCVRSKSQPTYRASLKETVR